MSQSLELADIIRKQSLATKVSVFNQKHPLYSYSFEFSCIFIHPTYRTDHFRFSMDCDKWKCDWHCILMTISGGFLFLQWWIKCCHCHSNFLIIFLVLAESQDDYLKSWQMMWLAQFWSCLVTKRLMEHGMEVSEFRNFIINPNTVRMASCIDICMHYLLYLSEFISVVLIYEVIGSLPLIAQLIKINLSHALNTSFQQSSSAISFAILP